MCDNEVFVIKFVHMLINFFVVKLSFLHANEGFIQAHFFIDFWINVLYNVYINLLVVFKWLVILYKNIVAYILGVCETGWLYQWYSTLS